MTSRIAAALLALAALPLAAAEPVLIPGRFSASAPGGLPEGWTPFSFTKSPRQTIYRLVQADGVTVLQAEADASVSALMRRIEFDPAEYPLLRWRWKVENVLVKGDIRRKDGDDYPARIYVLFDYDLSKLSPADRFKVRFARLAYGPDTPAAALCYVWDNKAEPGTIVPNAYTDRVRMIVVRSGPRDAGRWVSEERNLSRDFRAAFGEEAPRVYALVVASDTDNTGERAVAYFGDISAHPAPR